MEIRTQKNYNFETRKEVFGISIKVEGGRKYCKYPVGYQNFCTLSEAEQAKIEVSKLLANGSEIIYASGESKGVNKSEYVKINSNR